MLNPRRNDSVVSSLNVISEAPTLLVMKIMAFSISWKEHEPCLHLRLETGPMFAPPCFAPILRKIPSGLLSVAMPSKSRGAFATTCVSLHERAVRIPDRLSFCQPIS